MSKIACSSSEMMNATFFLSRSSTVGLWESCFNTSPTTAFSENHVLRTICWVNSVHLYSINRPASEGFCVNYIMKSTEQPPHDRGHMKHKTSRFDIHPFSVGPHNIMERIVSSRRRISAPELGLAHDGDPGASPGKCRQSDASQTSIMRKLCRLVSHSEICAPCACKQLRSI